MAVRTDHTVEAEVERLFARVRAEQGRLNVLVNDIWGGDAFTEWGAPFRELSTAEGFAAISSTTWPGTRSFGSPTRWRPTCTRTG